MMVEYFRKFHYFLHNITRLLPSQYGEKMMVNSIQNLGRGEVKLEFSMTGREGGDIEDGSTCMALTPISDKQGDSYLHGEAVAC